MYWKKKQDPIKICAKLTAKLLKIAHKLKVLKFKMDEYPLQRQIYLLTFMESLEMIFSQYKDTCEVLIDYPTIGGQYIKDYVKKATRNLQHANIDVHSRRLIVGFPVDGVKLISKIQSHCADMTFSQKVDMIGLSIKYHIKERNHK